MFAGGMSLWHWIIVAGVVALLFGRGTVTRLMADFGGGLRELKRAGKELVDTKDTVEREAKLLETTVKKDLPL
jgi:sec-independent protein translocase protein TatA